MKKNRTLRMASVLLILVLLTTSVIGGTFAKYVTEVSAEDKARVAYWGWKPATMTLTDLFSPQYIETKVTENGTVLSQDGDDVIAPGTSGSVEFAFAYAENNMDETVTADTVAQGVNAPEVKYSFAVTVEGTCDNDIKANKNIKWKLDTGNWGTWDEMIAAIINLSGDSNGSKDYEPGKLPDAFGTGDDVHTIAWQWLYNGGSETYDHDNDDTTAKIDQDAYDTYMGNKTTLDTCSITITITATQLT